MLLRPVLEDVVYAPFVRAGDVQRPGLEEDFAELFAHFADGGGVHDGKEFLVVLH